MYIHETEKWGGENGTNCSKESCYVPNEIKLFKIWTNYFLVSPFSETFVPKIIAMKNIPNY